MIAAIFLAVALFVMWVLFFIVQFAAALSLVAVVIAMMVTAGAYGFSFLGFYYLFGPSNIGWAIFAAMFLGTVLVREIWKSAKRGLSRNAETSPNER
jgi:hypothetical protein